MHDEPSDLAGQVKRVLVACDSARRHAEDRGLTEPVAHSDPPPPPPSLIGHVWRTSGQEWGMGFPARAKRACVGNLPRETGNPSDFAARFPWWPDEAHSALLGSEALVVLNGPPRSGKTTIACWLALRHEVWSAWDLWRDPPRLRIPGYTQLYARGWDLLEKLKSRFRGGDGESLALRCRRAHFAVFDDLEEAESAWETKTVGSIVMDRVENGLPTVLCMDGDAEDFQRRWPSAMQGVVRKSGTIVNMSPGAAPEVASKSQVDYL